MSHHIKGEASEKDTVKAREAWQEMTFAERTAAQPEGRKRARPGSTGKGDYYRVVVRPGDEFATLRTQDVGTPGHILRVAGQRASGSWDTQAYLIGKNDAHPQGDTLVGDSEDARQLLAKLGTKPKHVQGDIYEAKDKPNVPEKKKPTVAQQRAWMANIKKAQAARRASPAKK